MSRDVVLVVEDEPMLRADAAMLLDEAGLHVVAVESADEAIAFTAAQPDAVAAIFTDIQMPGHSDGLHLAEIIGRHWPEIKVLLTSGRITPANRLPANVSFVQKPWLPLQVLAAMQSAVAA